MEPEVAPTVRPLDLSTERATKLTTISRFAAALAKVLERPDIGHKLADGCADKGVLNVGALRSLGYDGQLGLYQDSGLGSMFNNTINQFIVFDGEDNYVPDAPAYLGALASGGGGGGGGALPQHRTSQNLSFQDLTPKIPRGFDCKRDIQHLPGMVLEVLPSGKGRPIIKTGPLIHAIKDWLVLRFSCVHAAHPESPVSVETLIQRIATLIVEDRGHAIFEGNPSVHYTGATAVELVNTKVKSKLTQDRQHYKTPSLGPSLGPKPDLGGCPWWCLGGISLGPRHHQGSARLGGALVDGNPPRLMCVFGGVHA